MPRVRVLILFLGEVGNVARVLRQVDFLGEDERYKLEFATGLHEQVRLQVFPKGVVGALERQGAMAVVRARAEARGRLSPQVRRRIASVLRWQY